MSSPRSLAAQTSTAGQVRSVTSTAPSTNPLAAAQDMPPSLDTENVLAPDVQVLVEPGEHSGFGSSTMQKRRDAQVAASCADGTVANPRRGSTGPPRDCHGAPPTERYNEIAQEPTPMGRTP